MHLSRTLENAWILRPERSGLWMTLCQKCIHAEVGALDDARSGVESASIHENPRRNAPGYFFTSAGQLTTRVRGVEVSSGR